MLVLCPWQAAGLVGKVPPELWLQLEQQGMAQAQQGAAMMAAMQQATNRGAQRQADKEYGRSCTRCGVLEVQVGSCWRRWCLWQVAGGWDAVLWC
jgi:hypothetical protein